MALTKRQWDILHWISAEKPIEDLQPPLTKDEERFYRQEKADYDEIKPKLPKGVKFMWTPANE